VAARVRSELGAFLKRLSTVWNNNDNDNSGHSNSRSKIFVIKASEETSNLIVIALKLGPSSSSSSLPNKSNKNKSDGNTNTNTNRKVTLESILENWLRMAGQSSDPLKLLSSINKIIDLNEKDGQQYMV